MITPENALKNPAFVSIINGELLPEEISREEISRLNNADSALCYERNKGNILKYPKLPTNRAASSFIDEAVGNFRDFLKKFLDSPKLLEELSIVCSILNMSVKIKKLDRCTRRNSTLGMIYRLIELEPAIAELLRRIRYRHEGLHDFKSLLTTALPPICLI